MKAIIIEEARFAELCELLRGIKSAGARDIDQFVAMHLGKEITEENVKVLVQDIHHAFHCAFVRWAQSHGASCVR